MTKKDDRLRELLKKRWRVNIDQGHKSALRHKMSELDLCERPQNEPEYSDSHQKSRSERTKTLTIIRTDMRPVWAAVFILLAVVIILIPQDRIATEISYTPTILSTSPFDVKIRDTSQLEEEEPFADIFALSEPGSKILQHRFIYMYDDIMFESKTRITRTQAVEWFRAIGLTGEIDVDNIQVLEVMVPENYELESRDGNTIYYHAPELNSK